MKKFLVPSNLYIGDLIKKHSVKHIKGYSIDKFHFICHAIQALMTKLDEDNLYPNKREPYFVPLSSEILTDIIGSNYKEYLNWMIKCSILHTDNHYKKGVFSIGYRFTDKYLFANSKFIKCTNRAILRKVSVIQDKFIVDKIVCKKLSSYIRDEKLQVNKKIKRRVFKQSYVEHERALVNAKDKDDYLQLKNKHSINIKRATYLLHSISDKGFKIVQDDFGFRIHTPLSLLKKEFRSCLEYNGESLVEIDINNCQFFLFNYLLDYRNWASTSSVNSYLYTRLLEDTSIPFKVRYTYIIMYLKRFECLYGKGFQDTVFFRDSCNGHIYNNILEKLESDSFFKPGWNYDRKRKYVKKNIIGLLFADKDEHYRYYNSEAKAVLEAFNSLYPEVYSLINTIKAYEYNDFCRIIQKLETACIIKHVCGKWLKEHPDKPIFTIHDCLITTKSNALLLEHFMRQEITAFIGCTPSLSIKSWSLNHNDNDYNKAA